MRILRNYLYNRRNRLPVEWRPLIAFYYLTNSCNFECPYCDTGPFLMDSGGARLRDILPGKDVLSLLQRVRRHTDYLVITGGEPLTHPDFGLVMSGLKALNFKKIILATNGYSLSDHVSSIVSAADTIVISLDTLNPEKAGVLSGKGPGTLQKVLDGIDLLSGRPGLRHRISISAVITPDNIEDIYEVFRYARGRGFEFAANPQLVGVRAHQALTGSSRYRQLYDFLIRQKKSGENIYGTVRYLEQMRDFTGFTCFPLAMLVITPVGGVYYPCLEGGSVVASLFNEPDLNRIAAKGRSLHPGLPSCDHQCHSGCMLGISLALQYPLSLIREAAHYLARISRSALRTGTA